ncbi:MAG TPA: hypothetical protein VGI79_20645 [Caulobacteraceae bacterium]|jgi:hypothetical protein
MDIDLKSTHYTEQLPVAPLTVADVQKVAPIAVHLKELNQIAPLMVESLRVDHVRHVDPLRIERLDITRLPSVNITLSQLPSMDINVRRVPPVAIAIQQQFDMGSDYTIIARLLGLPLLRMTLSGRTTISPRDCARREQSRSHERSFPDVAAAGNPAIPSHAIETCTETVSRRPQRPRPCVHPGAPRFGFSLRPQSLQTEAVASAAPSAVNGG